MAAHGGGNNKSALVPGAKDVLGKMKYETAQKLDISVQNKEDWGDVPSRECGRVGGQIGGKMVRSMIRIAEQQLVNRQ